MCVCRLPVEAHQCVTAPHALHPEVLRTLDIGCDVVVGHDHLRREGLIDAVARTAIQLQAREIVFGESAKMTAQDQALRLGETWDRVPHDRSLATHLAVYSPDGSVKRFSLGAHAPALSPDDVERIHQLWTEAIKTVGPELHHRDVVAAALASFEEELSGEQRLRALDRLRRQASG